MAHFAKATDGGPAANTRAIAARVPARTDSGSELESANGIIAGEESKINQDPQQQQLDEPDVDAATDDAATDRVTIASLMKEMKSMRDELSRLKQQPQQQQPSSFSFDSSSSSSSQHQPSSTNSVNDVATLVRSLQIGQTQQLEQLRQQQAATTAQLQLLQSLSEFLMFNAKKDDTTSHSSSVASSSPTYLSNRRMAPAVNSRRRIGTMGHSDSSDRNRTSTRGSGVAKEVPPDLAESRQQAGLCIRCGIVKYESSDRGHNSRTCQADVDKTTSIAEGLRKANL